MFIECSTKTNYKKGSEYNIKANKENFKSKNRIDPH